jgi:MFS family permease
MSGAADTILVLRAIGRNRPLRRELTAYFLFASAEWGTWIAMLVFAFDRGGATAAGLVAVIQLVPAIFVAPLGSVMGDQLRRDRALGIGYLAQAITLGAAAAAMLADAPVAVIYGLAALATCAITLTRPVHQAILPTLAETPQELTASNAASSTLEGLSVFTGPVGTGLILAVASPGAVYALMAVAQVVAFTLTLRLHLHGPTRVERPDGSEGVVSSALGGFRALRHEPDAAALTGLVGAQQVVVGLFEVLVVVIAIETLNMGQSGPGLLTGGDGIGAIVGAAATVTLIGRRRMAPAIGSGILLTGVPLALVAVAPGAALALILFSVFGFGKAFFDVAARTLLQRSVDDDVLARVFGLQEGLHTAGLAIGAGLASVLEAVFGSRGAFVVAGAFLPVLGLACWGRIRSLDKHAHVPGPELALLRSIDLFEPLEQPILEQLSWNLIPVEMTGGEVVITEGEAGDLFYIIAEGEAEVAIGGRTITTLGPGQYFGEIALIRDVPRTATVTAAGSLRLLALERDEFLSAITGSVRSAEAAHRTAALRLHEDPAEPDGR